MTATQLIFNYLQILVLAEPGVFWHYELFRKNANMSANFWEMSLNIMGMFFCRSNDIHNVHTGW